MRVSRKWSSHTVTISRLEPIIGPPVRGAGAVERCSATLCLLWIGMEAATVTALRRAGWTVEQIVTEARISPGEVAVALGAPGPRVNAWTLPTLVRAVTWAESRRAGQPVVQMAAQAGVSHQRVSALTLPFGPYPRPTDPVAEWVTARRAGQPLSTIACDYQVSTDRVSKATAPHGPFPYPRRHPNDAVSTPEIARMFGVAEPTVRRWQTKTGFPPPRLQTRPPLWDTAAVQAWADRYLTTCRVCAARVLNLPRHRGVRRH